MKKNKYNLMPKQLLKIAVRNAAPYYEYVVLEAVHRTIPKILKYRKGDNPFHPLEIIISKDGKSTSYYYGLDNWIKYSEFVNREISKGLYDKTFFAKTKERMEKKLKKIEEEIKKNKNLKLSNSKKFFKMYDLYNNAVLEMNAIMFIAADIAYAIEEELKKFIISKTKDESKTDYWFKVLTTYPETTFITLEKISFYKIAKKIFQNHNIYKIFKRFNKDNTVSKKIIKEYPNIWQDIKKHTQKYGWLRMEYVNQPANEEDCVKELSDLIKSKDGKFVAAQLKNLSKSSTKAKKEQRVFYKKYKLTKKERDFLYTVAASGYFYEYGKLIKVRTYFIVKPLIEEIGKRMRVDWLSTLYLFPEEIKKFLLFDKRVMQKTIKERKKIRIMIYKDKKIVFMIGKKARMFIEKNIPEEKIERNILEIRGTIASKGIARGKAKIVLRANEQDKVEYGDILVTIATTPEFVPCIKKAKAIIADEGGLLSHAAIISREMNIPCIVGTNIATKVLKDSNIIEVDANKGIVKIIK